MENKYIQSKLSQKISGIKYEYKNLTELKVTTPEIWKPSIVNLFLIKRLPENNHTEILNNLKTRFNHDNFTKIKTHFICDVELEVDEHFLEDLEC